MYWDVPYATLETTLRSATRALLLAQLRLTTRIYYTQQRWWKNIKKTFLYIYMDKHFYLFRYIFEIEKFLRSCRCHNILDRIVKVFVKTWLYFESKTRSVSVNDINSSRMIKTEYVISLSLLLLFFYLAFLIYSFWFDDNYTFPHSSRIL